MNPFIKLYNNSDFRNPILKHYIINYNFNKQVIVKEPILSKSRGSSQSRASKLTSRINSREITSRNKYAKSVGKLMRISNEKSNHEESFKYI